jgi:maleylpyruvate isomerase
MRPDEVIETCRRANRSFVAAVAPLSDVELASPSLLPSYSRRHVVARVINKTEAHVLLFGGPPAGEVRRLHPEGHDADRAAHQGAARARSDLYAALERSFIELEGAGDALDDTMWESLGIMTAGPRTMADIAGHHLRNVEVHHVDLDVGYLPSDWPGLFVETELIRRLPALADRADHADLLAWLLGRGPAPELTTPW